MSTSRNLGPLLIILVVLLLAVGGYWIKEGKLIAKFSFGSTPKNFTLDATAKEGSVIAGFPTELLGLIRDAEVLESSRYKGDDAEVRRVLYRTSVSIPDLFAAYVNYFTDHGYTLTDIDAQGGITGIVAESDDREVSVSMYISGPRLTEVRIDEKKPVIQ